MNQLRSAKPSPTISIQTLNEGMRLWMTHRNWPNDFHSRLYLDLSQLLNGGLTPIKWENLVNILWDWRAIRPKTKRLILERGDAVLDELNLEVQTITKNHSIQVSNIDVAWEEVSDLFKIAENIKGVSSPVFASKLCHFLFPAIFPVVDNAYIGVNEAYVDYWKRCKELWAQTDNGLKDILIARLGEFISPEYRPSYPWSTKIVEICLAGQVGRKPILENL